MVLHCRPLASETSRMAGDENVSQTKQPHLSKQDLNSLVSKPYETFLYTPMLHLMGFRPGKTRTSWDISHEIGLRFTTHVPDESDTLTLQSENGCHNGPHLHFSGILSVHSCGLFYTNCLCICS